MIDNVCDKIYVILWSNNLHNHFNFGSAMHPDLNLIF